MDSLIKPKDPLGLSVCLSPHLLLYTQDMKVEEDLTRKRKGSVGGEGQERVTEVSRVKLIHTKENVIRN